MRQLSLLPVSLVLNLAIHKERSVSRAVRDYSQQTMIIIRPNPMISDPNPPSPPSIHFTYKSPSSNRDSYKLPEALKSCFLRRSASEKEVEKFDIQNFIVRSTMTGCICNLCETRYRLEEMGVININCSHTFCNNCIRDYIIYKISVMEEISCPQEGCEMTIDTSIPSFQELPREYKEKYNNYLIWKQTMSNPNLKLCPTEHCKGMIDIRESFSCNVCRTQFCPECMLKRHEGPCDLNFQRNFKEWKRCPACNMFIQKNEGCNHMTCLCHHQFCYICLSDWDQNHYQCGEVANVLHGGPFHHYFLPPDVQEISRPKKMAIGIIMFILFPVAAALAIAIFIACIAGGAALAVLIGPCVIATNTYSQDCCPVWCIILVVALPIAMAFSAIGAAIAIAYHGIKYLCDLLQSYCSTMRFFICSDQPDEYGIMGDDF